MVWTKLVLWIYIVLLLVGGAIGYFKAGSLVSLVMSAGFALFLVLCAVGVLPSWVADVLLGVLAGFFLFRLIKTGKFMPAGMMAIVTIVALVLRLLL